MQPVDDVLWIWWYDREGAIQSQGINFIQDVPRFLVLLLAFQRFSLEDWGFNLELNPQAELNHDSSVDDRGSPRAEATRQLPFDLTFTPSFTLSIHTNDVISSWYSLTGRGTDVLGASTKSNHPVSGEFLDGVPLAVKIYWPEVSRVSEETVLRRAEEFGTKDPDIAGHLPDLVCCRDFGISTGGIRDALGIANTAKSNGKRSTKSRTLRVLVFRRLDPITTLVGKEFVRAWLECLRCAFLALFLLA